MRVAKLKVLARERGLRGYSRMRKAEIIELIRNNQQGPPRNWPRPTRPNQTQLVKFRPDCPRQPLRSGPTQQEMDIFEQQEMSKSLPQVTSKLNDWYDWLVKHISKTVIDKASRAFKTFKDVLAPCPAVGPRSAEAQRPTEPKQIAFSGLTEAIGLMEGLEWM